MKVNDTQGVPDLISLFATTTSDEVCGSSEVSEENAWDPDVMEATTEEWSWTVPGDAIVVRERPFVPIEDALDSIYRWKGYDKQRLFDALLGVMHPDTTAALYNRSLEGIDNGWQAAQEKPFDIHDGFIDAITMPAAKLLTRLWMGIYPGRVTLLNGETGAGKSVILLNIAIHAALNEPLWGIGFDIGRPLRVLYIDPENSGNFGNGDGGIVAMRLERLGKGRPQGLMFHDGQGLDLSNPDHARQLLRLVKEREVDLVILDPYINLFAMTNENDNREAAANMKVINRLSRETGAAVVLCHHTGKMNEEKGSNNAKFGRGASSLLGAADVGMTLQVKKSGAEEDQEDGTKDKRQRNDVCRLQVEKNRLIGEHEVMYLKMAGNEQFDRVTAAQFSTNSEKPDVNQIKMRKLRELIEEKMLDYYNDCSRTELVKAAKVIGVGRPMVEELLDAMVNEGTVTCRNGGHGVHLYRLALASMQYVAPTIGDQQTAHCLRDEEVDTLSMPESSLQFAEPLIEEQQTENWRGNHFATAANPVPVADGVSVG